MGNINKEHIKPVLIIFFIAIIARLVFCILVYLPLADKFGGGHYPGQFNFYKDDKYDDIARNLLWGKGYSSPQPSPQKHIGPIVRPDITRPPVYPLILALQFYLFGDGYRINLLINIIYQSLVCIILYYLTLMMFNKKKIAVISALIWALYPLPMVHAMGPWSEAIYELFLISFTYFFYMFYKLKKTQYLFYFSLLMVILTLTRPVTILFPLYFLVLTLVNKEFLFRDRIKQIMVLSLIFMIGISPWIYRAYKITGRIVPLITYSTPVFYGNVAKTRPGRASVFLEEIKKPQIFLKNSLIRLFRFWYYTHKSTKVSLIKAFLQFSLLLLSISGIWWARKQKYLIFPFLLIICFIWLAYSALSALQSTARYSYPVIVLLCPFAAIGTINFINWTFKTKIDL